MRLNFTRRYQKLTVNECHQSDRVNILFRRSQCSIIFRKKKKLMYCNVQEIFNIT